MSSARTNPFRFESFQPQGSFRAIVCMLVLCGALCLPSRAEAFAFQDRISLSKGLAHYAMGQMYDLLGMTNRAVMEYEKSIQYDEGSYLTHLRLGADYARLDLLDEAIKHLSMVSTHNPQDLQSHYLLALIYSTQRRYDEAAVEYEYILKSFSEAEPQNIEIYGYLGQLYYSQKKYNQAIEQFEQILTLEPTNADVMYLLGSLYLEVNKPQKAINHLKQSLTVDPRHDGSLNTLGYIYAQQGIHLDEAQKLIEQALVLSPDNGAYLDSLGWVYYQKGEYEQALETLLKADQAMTDPVIFEHLGDVYRRMDRPREAVENWKRSLELMPDREDLQRKIDEVESSQANQAASGVANEPL